MKNLARYFNLMVLLTHGSLMVHSQNLDDTIQISEVEVTSILARNKSVADRSELDQSVISRQAGTSLTDLLSRHSTIYVRSTGRGTLATASFRGTDGSHTRVFWNGIEMNSAMNGQVDLSLMPVFFFDEAEIYYGGSSLTSNSGALGGTVNLASKPEWSGKMKGSLLQEFASFKTYNLMSRIDVSRNKWYSGTRLFYNYSRNDYRYINRSVSPARTDRIRNGSYSMYGLLQEVYCRLDADNLLSFRLWAQQAGRDLPQIASYEGSGRKEHQDDRSGRFTVAWQKYYPMGTLEFNSGISLTSLTYMLRSVEAGHNIYDSQSREFSMYNTVEHKHRLSDRLMIRSQLRMNLDKVDNYDQVGMSGYDIFRPVASLMSSAYRTIGKRTTTWLVVRQDMSGKKLLPVMPSAGIEFRLPEQTGVTVKSNITRNCKMPDLNDLYWVPGGNPALKPEKGLSGDVSLEFNKKMRYLNWSARMAGFYADITDWIIWKPGAYQYWMADNLQHVITRGFEGHLHLDANFNMLELAFTGNFTYTRATSESRDSRIPAASGRQLVYLPIHAGNATMTAACKGYFVNWICEYTGKRLTQTGDEITGYEIILNPFLVNDIIAGKNIRLMKHEFIFQLAVMNLFNREYQMVYSRPMPGRNYLLRIGYKF